MLVAKGSNFVHGEEFLPIFQILIFLFLVLSICKLPIFLMLPVSTLNTIVDNYVVTYQKKLCRNLDLVNLN